MLIDTHCHLDFPDFNPDREDVIKRARENGLAYIINIGSSLRGSRDAVHLSRQYDLIYAAVGLHPHEADSFDGPVKEELKSLAGDKKVVAIGEIGLDYFKNYSSKDNQKKAFIDLLGMAKERSLPVVIHCRQAESDILSLLKEAKPQRAVIHCFSGTEDFLIDCLQEGFFISFTCNITYRKAEGLRQLVKRAPLERIFLETDAPFLPPEGMRGRRNEPSFVKNLADEIARIKGLDASKVAEITTANAKQFFNLP